MSGRWAALLLAAATSAVAQQAATEGEAGDKATFRLPVALKGTLVATRARGWLAPSSDRFGAASLWRLRVEPSLSLDVATFAVAYEQALAPEEGLFQAAGMGAPRAAPFRLQSLQDVLAEGNGGKWTHELDRAWVALHLGALELTLGRQGIGWGRGALFRAADLFAPFSPLEFDRDWRRGIDAARAEVRLLDRWSVEVVLAGAEREEDAAALGRVRGFAGDVDLELLGGWRAGAWIAGATASAAVGGAEVHGEAVFHRLEAPWPLGGGWFGGRTAGAFVLGSSYTFDVGTGLTVVGEYCYSGFGAEDVGALLRHAADPAVSAWIARGDAQIAGRHGIGAVASYAPGLTTGASLAVLVDPADGSGLAALTATWDAADSVRVVAAVYLPYGAPVGRLGPQSTLGGTPVSAIVQVRVDEDVFAAQ